MFYEYKMTIAALMLLAMIAWIIFRLAVMMGFI